MAGNKNSGRKSTMEEFKNGCLLTMTTSWLINNWARFNDDQKMEVALKIAPKGIADKHEHSGALDVSGILSRMAAVSNVN